MSPYDWKVLMVGSAAALAAGALWLALAEGLRYLRQGGRHPHGNGR